jgi:gamma-glutamyltranspeptidase
VSVSSFASDIRAATLARGGNAVDAAVATAFALAVTHPSAGNIGGGGFMVVRMASGEATTFDFREKAPLSATPTMFQTADGAIAYALTDSGWLSPGVPGTVHGMESAHARLGKLPWRSLVLPAAQLAAQGFPLSRALAAVSAAAADHVRPLPRRWLPTDGATAGVAGGRPTSATSAHARLPANGARVLHRLPTRSSSRCATPRQRDAARPAPVPCGGARAATARISKRYHRDGSAEFEAALLSRR